MILKPREGEQDTDLVEAREIYKNTKDSRLAYQKINRVDKIEAKILWGLNICGHKNPQGVLDMVPRNQMLMYVHAYQSLIWNKMVSKRIEQYGLKPVVGDLVFENPEKDDFETVLDDPRIAEEEEEKVDTEPNAEASVKKDSEQVGETTTETQQKTDETKEEHKSNDGKSEEKDSKNESDKSSEKGDGEKPLPKVKVLTEADLANYTIADVIMPQPGWKVTYPTYAKQWFEEQLEKDGLTIELKQKNK